MKRLHIGASRFERLSFKTIEMIADSSWIHLGDAEVDWKTKFKTELQRGNWYFSAQAVYRSVRPLHNPQKLEEFYSKTDFREFCYQAGDRLDFENSTFDFIYSEHFLEHLFMDETLELLKEFHRILKLMSGYGLSLWHDILDQHDTIWKSQQTVTQKRGQNLVAPVPKGAIGQCGYLNELSKVELYAALTDYKAVCAAYPRHGRGIEPLCTDVGLEDPSTVMPEPERA